MNIKYTAISGYHRSPDFTGPDTFFKTWIENLVKAVHAPQQLIIIADSNARPPLDDLPCQPPFYVTVVPLAGDLGNCHALLCGIKTNKFSGWTGVVLAGALLCYANETDMVFVEEDMLMFGDCIGKMYEEIGDAGIIFGKSSFMPSAQSLFLVRHSYILEFVKLFLSQGAQDLEENLGEAIFARLQRENPEMWKRFSFGYDRNRPLNYDDQVWYVQHLTGEELAELKRRGMI